MTVGRAASVMTVRPSWLDISGRETFGDHGTGQAE